MVRLVKAFQSIVPIKTLVVGDFMLDTYTKGTVDRISPEAPVPILKVNEHSSKAGGAGNVVLNLLALGSSVCAMGRIGSDEEGKKLLAFLKDKQAFTDYLFEEDLYETPVKHRFIADNQQLIRVDREKNTPLSTKIENEILSLLPSIIQKVDVIAISDYGKGFLSDRLLLAIIEEGRKAHVPIIVDPKGIDFTKYKGATLIKPNVKEAYGASKLASSASLLEVANVLLEMANTDYLVITRSSEGISLYQKNEKESHFPVRSVKEVKDVTGAGDTVLATLTMALGNKLPIADALQLSNLAAGIAVERFGCAHVSFSDLARRLLELDFQNKIYDETHLFVLKEALREKPFSLLVLAAEEGISSSFFHHVQELAKNKDQYLICYIKDLHPDEGYVTLLSSLKEVDFIILQKNSLENLFLEITPKQVYEMKGKTLVKWDESWELLKSLLEYSYCNK